MPLLWIGLLAPGVFGQGSLVPPGAPAPGMKTLAQIEARTPVETAPFTIDTPGSYYLTGNLHVSSGDAITITSSQVTLDLNGFTISSSSNPASGSGVLISNTCVGVTISNGHIAGNVVYTAGTFAGEGFDNGIAYVSGGVPRSIRVTGVSVRGCFRDGISVNPRDTNFQESSVEHCLVATVGGNGIVAGRVAHSTATECGSYGISALGTGSNCRGESVSLAMGAGVTAIVASNCHGTSVTGRGIDASTAENCYGISGSGSGIFAQTVTNSVGVSTSGLGIFCFSVTNSQGNSQTGNGVQALMATGTYGFSQTNRGITAEIATGCYGGSGGASFGIFAGSVATNCVGGSNTGTGLATKIAVACVGTSTSGPPISYNFHYNMPP